MRKLKLLISYLLFLCLTSFVGCKTSVESVKVLKLGHGLPQSHSVHLGMVHMAERLEEISKGKMKIEIYPGAQLGSETQCIELLQIGSLAITKVSAAAIEGFVEEFKVFSLPYLFESKEHLYKVLDGEVGKYLLNKPEKYLFRGLGYYDAGSRNFYTIKKPILTPDDLKGLKIRVMKSPISVQMMEVLGGSATPISWGELYTALQSGVVDGAENNIPSFTTAHHQEVSKHFSFNEHTMIPDLLIVSKVIWDGLTPQQQSWLQQAMDESVVYQKKLWEEQEKESLQEAKEAGVNIHYPDKQPFIDKATKMHEDLKNNTRVYDLITKIKAVGEEIKKNNEQQTTE